MNSLLREHKICVLAEIAQSYEGNVEVLLQTSQKACEAGVDGLLFQVVFADELAVPEYTHYNLFKRLELSSKHWGQVIDIIHGNGKLAIGEIFGRYSAHLMMHLGIDGYKIHASDLSNLSLLRYVGGLDMPVLLSVGGAFESEISKAIRVLRESGEQEIILLHGYQLCPTAIPDSNFFKIRSLQKHYHLPVGYSDHVSGCVDNRVEEVNMLAYYFPLIALGAGARLIEKHIILDRRKAWEDYESALAAEEFSYFVQLIRTVEASLGAEALTLNEAEEEYRKRAKKYLVAAKAIPKDTTLSKEHIAFKRIQSPEEGLINIEEALGKKVSQELKPNDIIKGTLLR